MTYDIIPISESDRVEFKTSFTEDVIVSLVAFSNTKGGVVYIGISDNAKVKGIQIGVETIQKWINEVKNKTVPQLIPDAEILNIENKTVLVLSIKEYPIKPVSLKGRFYQRINNSNHLMSIGEIANEHLKTLNTSWDFYVDPNHGIDSISLDKVERFVREIEQRTENEILFPTLEFLSKMEILREGKLTFGAYLLFAKDYCLISDVQVGRFKSDITIIDSISLNTDLITEVDDIIAFIKKHLMIEYIITGEPQRTERYDYPLDAIREIVINMIVHRDYRESSASIIKIFDDRIEFYNPGKLYDGLTVNALLSGDYTSKSRNKLIAKAFKEIGLIERYGSGIMRIQNICKEYGVVEPLFYEVANGFMVTLYKEKIPYSGTKLEVFTDYPVYKVPDKVPDRVPDKVPDRVPDKVSILMTDNQDKILKLLEGQSKMSMSELSEHIGISKRKILDNINKLRELGLLGRIGNNKTGHWQINK